MFREENATREEYDPQVDLEERRKDKGLDRGVEASGIGKAACHHHGEHATEADVAFRVEGLAEDLDERLRGKLHSSSTALMALTALPALRRSRAHGEHGTFRADGACVFWRFLLGEASVALMSR